LTYKKPLPDVERGAQVETDRETRPRKITPAAFAAYSDPIMDAIRRSASAIRVYLDTGQTDATIWPPATG
jgi:hypothetical protein